MRAMWEVQGQSPLRGDDDLLVCLLTDPQDSALCDSQAIRISWIRCLFLLWLNIYNIHFPFQSYQLAVAFSAVSTFTSMCRCHHPSPECLHLSELKLHPHYAKPSISSASQPGNHGPFYSIPMNLPTPGTLLHKWNHTRCVLLWLAYSTNVFKVHSYPSIGQNFLPL